jgi:hypothetical protein
MSRFAPMNLLQRVRAATPVLARQVATALQMNQHSKTRDALWATLVIGRRAMRAELIKGLYTFHWGIERVKPRYRIPESAVSSHRLGQVQLEQEQKGRAHNA